MIFFVDFFLEFFDFSEKVYVILSSDLDKDKV